MIFLFTLFASEQSTQETNSTSNQESSSDTDFERELTDTLDAMAGGDDKPLYSEPSKKD